MPRGAKELPEAVALAGIHRLAAYGIGHRYWDAAVKCPGTPAGLSVVRAGAGPDAGAFSRLSESTRKVASTTTRSPGRTPRRISTRSPKRHPVSTSRGSKMPGDRVVVE